MFGKKKYFNNTISFCSVLVMVISLLIVLGSTFFSSSDVFGENIIYGDVNGDASVNPLDSVILARSLAGWNGYSSQVDVIAADVDDNCVINPMDLTCLNKYLGMWVGYETLPHFTVTEEPTATPTATPTITPTATPSPTPSYVSPYTYKDYDKLIYDFNRDQILIGVFDFNKNVCTDAGMQEFVDFGGNFIIHANKAVYPFAEKYNIGVLAANLNTQRDTFGSASTMADVATIESFDGIGTRYSSYNCVWGDDIFDEPNSFFFSYFDQIVDKYREEVPTKMPFFNLHPMPQDSLYNYTYFGTDTYDEYIQAYANTVDTDYICFDVYPFNNNFDGFSPIYYQNMDIVSTACRESGRDFWIISQAGSVKDNGTELNSYQVSFQAYTSLAYGATAIIHACYTPSWWNPETSLVNVLGVKNPLWNTTKKLNNEIHALSDVFMDYDSEGVIAVKSDFSSYGNLSYLTMIDQLDWQNSRSAKRGYTSVDGFANFNFGSAEFKAVLIGGFGEKNGDGNAVMIVNQSDPYAPVATTVFFETTEPETTVTAYIQGVPTVLTSNDNVYSVTIPAGEGVFVVSD